MLVTIFRRQWTILLLSVLGAAGMVYYHLALFVPRAMEVRASQGFGSGYSVGADFYPIWLTSRPAPSHRVDPYGPEMTRQIQVGLFGRSLDGPERAAPREYRAFAYPAFTDLLFWPLGLLPFSGARIALAVVFPVLTALSIVFWLRTLGLPARPMVLASLTLLTLSSYPVLEALFAEQVGLLAGFLLAASLAALVGRRLFLSGSLLALTLIKPQMMALAGVYLLLWSFAEWRERRRFVGGFLSVAGVLGICSLLVWPGWIAKWLQVMFGYRLYSTPPLVCYLLGEHIGSSLGPFVIAILLVAATAVAWKMRHASPTSVEFGLTVSLLLAVTAITLLPGHAVYDHVVLLPGALLIGFSWRNLAARGPLTVVVLGIAAFAFFWQWILAPLVIAAQLVLSHQVFVSRLLTLPIRTAASIPFCVFALLWLMMRQGRAAKLSGSRND